MGGESSSQVDSTKAEGESSTRGHFGRFRVVASATQIEDARLLFTETTKDIPSAGDGSSDSLASLRKELETLKLQRALQEELTSLRHDKPSSDGGLAKMKKELEELRAQQESK